MIMAMAQRQDCTKLQTLVWLLHSSCSSRRYGRTLWRRNHSRAPMTPMMTPVLAARCCTPRHWLAGPFLSPRPPARRRRQRNKGRTGSPGYAGPCGEAQWWPCNGSWGGGLGPRRATAVATHRSQAAPRPMVTSGSQYLSSGAPRGRALVGRRRRRKTRDVAEG